MDRHNALHNVVHMQKHFSSHKFLSGQTIEDAQMRVLIVG